MIIKTTLTPKIRWYDIYMVDNDAASKILSKLDDLGREVKVLRGDIGKTQGDLAFVKLRIRSVDDGNKAIQTDVSDMKSDLRRLEVLHEETDSVIQQIADSVSPFMEQTTELKDKLAIHEEKLDVYDKRLNFLEKPA